MLRARTWRRLAPKTRRMPVRTRWVPQTSSAMAASRFNRCFISKHPMIRPGPAAGTLVYAVAGLACAPDAQQFVEDQRDGADGDGRVGHVEGGEVPAAAPVELQEVDHVAMQQPVHHVADGA